MTKPRLIGSRYDASESTELPAWMRVTDLVSGASIAEQHGAQTADAEGTVEDAGPPAGYVEYWEPSGIMGTTSVTSWDGAANGIDWVPGGVAPNINSNWPGSLLQVEFVRANAHELIAPITSTAKSYTFGWLIKPVLNANWNTLLESPSFANLAIYLFNVNNHPHLYYAGNNNNLPTYDLTDAVQTLIYTLDATGNEWRLFVDGVDVGSNAYADTDLTTDVKIGGDQSPLSCALRAMAFYEGVLDAGNLALLHGWLNSFA